MQKNLSIIFVSLSCCLQTIQAENDNFTLNNFIQAKEYQKTISNSITRAMAVMENMPDKMLSLFEGQREMSQVFVETFEKITGMVDSKGSLTLSLGEIASTINKINKEYRDFAMQQKKNLMSMLKEQTSKKETPQIVQPKIEDSKPSEASKPVESNKPAENLASAPAASSETKTPEEKPTSSATPNATQATTVANTPTASATTPATADATSSTTPAQSSAAASAPAATEEKESPMDRLKKLRSQARIEAATPPASTPS